MHCAIFGGVFSALGIAAKQITRDLVRQSPKVSRPSRLHPDSTVEFDSFICGHGFTISNQPSHPASAV